MTTEADLPKTIPTILSQIQGGDPVWLVGGAVRDQLLGRESLDLDFVVDGDALAVARRLADTLGGDYFTLDEARGTGRALLSFEGDQRLTCDFARMRGPDIEADLLSRDFTINALAIRMEQPYERLDPLGGSSDLRAGRLRACSRSSLSDDPVRALRAVRLAAQFHLKIEPETLKLIRTVAPQITNVSAERARDEILQILGGERPGSALRLLKRLDLLFPTFPELESLEGRRLQDPLIKEALDYAFAIVARLEELLSLLRREHDPEAAAEMTLAQVAFRLGRYREQINAYMERIISSDRELRPLLFFGALYFPVGLAEFAADDETKQEQTVFLLGAESAGARARSLRLSNREVEFIEKLLYQQRIPSLVDFGASDRAREIHRFYRDMGKVGIGAVLLHLAGFLGAYIPPIPQNAWAQRLETARALLSAYFDSYERIVEPPNLVRGGELVEEFNLDPGPQIGKVLEAIREAQAAGAVTNREQAIQLARRLLEDV
jgi:tRNA nucleotidyltransferase/poly(A) polymerase